MGALGASPPSGGASRIPLPKYQDQKLLLGGWGQDIVVSPNFYSMEASDIAFPEKIRARVRGSVTEPYLGPDLEDLGCEPLYGF